MNEIVQGSLANMRCFHEGRKDTVVTLPPSVAKWSSNSACWFHSPHFQCSQAPTVLSALPRGKCHPTRLCHKVHFIILLSVYPVVFHCLEVYLNDKIAVFIIGKL